MERVDFFDKEHKIKFLKKKYQKILDKYLKLKNLFIHLNNKINIVLDDDNENERF